MVTRINLDSELDLNWSAKIERQINFSLASVHWQILQITIELHRCEVQAGSELQPNYQCRLQAELRSGRTQKISVVNKNPLACVADAAARLHRVVARDRQLGLMGRAR